AIVAGHSLLGTTLPKCRFRSGARAVEPSPFQPPGLSCLPVRQSEWVAELRDHFCPEGPDRPVDPSSASWKRITETPRVHESTVRIRAAATRLLRLLPIRAVRDKEPTRVRLVLLQCNMSGASLRKCARPGHAAPGRSTPHPAPPPGRAFGFP